VRCLATVRKVASFMVVTFRQIVYFVCVKCVFTPYISPSVMIKLVTWRQDVGDGDRP